MIHGGSVIVFILRTIDKHGAHNMKTVTARNSRDILHKIETIEHDLMDVKLSLLNKITPSVKNAIALKGLITDVDFTDTDIASAKSSLYSWIEP